jgi:hypothetical protein
MARRLKSRSRQVSLARFFKFRGVNRCRALCCDEGQLILHNGDLSGKQSRRGLEGRSGGGAVSTGHRPDFLTTIAMIAFGALVQLIVHPRTSRLASPFATLRPWRWRPLPTGFGNAAHAPRQQKDRPLGLFRLQFGARTPHSERRSHAGRGGDPLCRRRTRKKMYAGAQVGPVAKALDSTTIGWKRMPPHE